MMKKIVAVESKSKLIPHPRTSTKKTNVTLDTPPPTMNVDIWHQKRDQRYIIQKKSGFITIKNQKKMEREVHTRKKTNNMNEQLASEEKKNKISKMFVNSSNNISLKSKQQKKSKNLWSRLSLHK
ncbi:hypothetical protein CRE_05134 [Caenorhabditis remanei]|uniref:Uncharacterized protein n=1 Tax=Caenorhabditis remanei TaxID=31234 RepID=E3N692_CAERE|nr:hypothetical protein CRE_05134 [Caenorhabditis remanei]